MAAFAAGVATSSVNSPRRSPAGRASVSHRSAALLPRRRTKASDTACQISTPGAFIATVHASTAGARAASPAGAPACGCAPMHSRKKRTGGTRGACASRATPRGSRDVTGSSKRKIDGLLTSGARRCSAQLLARHLLVFGEGCVLGELGGHLAFAHGED